VTVRELCKSRPSESILSRRELQNLTSELGSHCSPRQPWFGDERLSLAQARDSSSKRDREEIWALLSAISHPGEKYWCFKRLCLAQARDIRLSEVAI